MPALFSFSASILIFLAYRDFKFVPNPTSSTSTNPSRSPSTQPKPRKRVKTFLSTLWPSRTAKITRAASVLSSAELEVVLKSLAQNHNVAAPFVNALDDVELTITQRRTLLRQIPFEEMMLVVDEPRELMRQLEQAREETWKAQEETRRAQFEIERMKLEALLDREARKRQVETARKDAEVSLLREQVYARAYGFSRDSACRGRDCGRCRSDSL